MWSASEVPSEVGYVRRSPRCRPPARPGSRRRARPARAAAARSRAGVSENVIGLRIEGIAAGPHDRIQPQLLGERDPVVDGVDRPARDAGGDELAEPLVRGPGRQPLDQQRAQLLPVGGAVLRCARTAGRRPAPATPSTSQSLRNWPSLPAVMISSSSAVGSASYGNRLGCELPIRVGVTPAGDHRAGVVDQPGQRRGHQVDLDVLPAAGRRRGRAARPARRSVACIPAITSKTEMPARYGWPPAGRRSGSSARRSPARSGRSRAATAPPPVPKPVIEA